MEKLKMAFWNHYFSSLFKIVWHTKCVLPNWRGTILVGLSRINGDKKRENFLPDLGMVHTTAKQLIRPEQWWNVQKWKMPLQSSLISETSEKIAFQLPLQFSVKIVSEITMWGTHQLVGFMLCCSDTVVKPKINSQLAGQVEEKNVRRLMIHLVPDISLCVEAAIILAQLYIRSM